MSIRSNYSEQELRTLENQELVELVLELQKKNKELQSQMGDLRNDVAQQFIEHEQQEENEVNTFRRLSVECAQNNIAIDLPQQRMGQNIDQCGSLNDVVTRKEPAIISMSQMSGASSNRSSVGKFVAGSMQATIQQMSNSLTSQTALKSSQSKQAPVIMSSFSSQNKISSTGSGAAPHQLTLGSSIPTGKQQNIPAQLVAKKIVAGAGKVEDDSDNNDVVI